MIVTFILAPVFGAYAQTLDKTNTTPKTQGNLTLKPIVFEVRDQQKVEAESGQLMVPETRGNSPTKMIALAFIRFKSSAQKPASPIVYLAGGPGESGINEFRGVPLSLLNEMRSVANVIALDQRGTGASEPREVTCQTLRSPRTRGPIRDRRLGPNLQTAEQCSSESPEVSGAGAGGFVLRDRDARSAGGYSHRA